MSIRQTWIHGHPARGDGVGTVSRCEDHRHRAVGSSGHTSRIAQRGPRAGKRLRPSSGRCRECAGAALGLRKCGPDGPLDREEMSDVPRGAGEECTREERGEVTAGAATSGAATGIGTERPPRGLALRCFSSRGQHRSCRRRRRWPDDARRAPDGTAVCTGFIGLPRESASGVPLRHRDDFNKSGALTHDTASMYDHVHARVVGAYCAASAHEPAIERPGACGAPSPTTTTPPATSSPAISVTLQDDDHVLLKRTDRSSVRGRHIAHAVGERARPRRRV